MSAPPATRRELIADAAVRVIARHGLRGLTHRAVDAEAGLPEGSCSAYLRTRAALLAAAAERVGIVLTGEVAELRGQVEAEGKDLGAAIPSAGAMLARWVERPTLLLAQRELALEALRQPDLREAIGSWRVRFVEIVEGIVEQVSGRDPHERAELVVAALQGVLETSLSLPVERRAAYVLPKAATLLVALAAAPDPSDPLNRPATPGAQGEQGSAQPAP